MKFEFKPCPDCGDNANCPMFFREVYCNNPAPFVKAVCSVCNWETKWHNNVKECADEWNSTVIYE